MSGAALEVVSTGVYGCFDGPPSRAELERCFYFDDEDLRVIGKRRGDHNRLGFGVQLGTVRLLGTFLADPLDVPALVVDYVADQLGVADPSCGKRYTQRRTTRFEHAVEIAGVYGYRNFAEAEKELAGWVTDQSWTTGDGPKALFDGAVRWLRERRVLLPGRSTLERLVGHVRDETTQRLYDELAGKLTREQAATLEGWLRVPDGGRVSALERLSTGPTALSGKSMADALGRVAEIAGLGFGIVDLTAVPQRRIVELARWAMTANATQLRRHPGARRLATLLAAAVYLEAKATDDALELFDTLMTNELIARAKRAANTETLRRYPQVSRDAATCAAALRVLFKASADTDATIDDVWEAIEQVVSRSELAAAVEHIAEVAPPADVDPGGEWRAGLLDRYRMVRRFVPQLPTVITFGATPDAQPVLDALKALPGLLEARATKRVPPGWLDAAEVAVDVVPSGWWRQLVFPPGRPAGTLDKAAYVFCVLEQFHRHLINRDIYAEASSRWADPRAKLLAGAAWEAAHGPVLNALSLPEEPGGLLAGAADDLDSAWRQMAAQLDLDEIDAEVVIDTEGRLHAAKLDAIPDPPSLVDLRRRAQAMLPRVDISELILEVMSWQPAFVDAFTSASGGSGTRLADVDVTIAACLTAHSLNVGFTPVLSPGSKALSRGRIGHVDQNYLRSETYAAANGPLVNGQANIGLAQHWGGGLVAAVDGIRFVVPVRSIDARPNPKYFGRRKGTTLLNLVTDQYVGVAGMVVSGTPRDTLHLVDLIYRQDSGARPEVIIADTGSYSDMIFGLLRLLGFDYRPQLADLPDTRLWRLDPDADYGPLSTASRNRIDPSRVVQQWPEILRVVASIHTGAVSAHDVIRMLARGGKPTKLGDALAHLGRIFKTHHVLSYVDEEPYRRQIKGMRNLQEGRHALARHIFHGRKGELYQAYRDGMEDQLGALGLVLNCVTFWNTVYLDAALNKLRADGYSLRPEDVARLSPYVRRHINVHGHYSFRLADLVAAAAARQLRPLRDPDTLDDDTDWR
ncbi:MAG: Tn3 family transposase [Acidimicrobiia bacterium]